MSDDKFLLLTKEQIKILEKNGCRSDSWDNVRVSAEFDPNRVLYTVFEGEVQVGSLKGNVILLNGMECQSEIRNACLRDVTIGDNCRISQVNGRLINLKIEDNVLIENVGTIVCTGNTTFGNGHEICPLNEGGGRELKITEKTSAQVAYLSVMYRQEKKFITNLDTIAESFAGTRQSDKAAIGKNSCITNCQSIENVFIGPYAVVDGAASLKNGTVVSSEEAPSAVGKGVIAENFIFQKGSSVKDGAMVSETLIGEGTAVGKQFSSENSLFFSNSECFHSEACSVFAGPYSVTHHRSTLLIAGYFSFYNAGSGTNQSNHMYKLGPLHQGIMERGCKTGSFSYLLWPSRIGAFTLVLGKHYSNFDTSEFPFSYIDEEDGKSTLIPGMNFFTVGTIRDGEKWPTRDKRKNSDKLDLIIFNVLSPYIGQKMIRGQRVLAELYEKAMKEMYQKSEAKPEYVTYNGIHIKRLLLKTCGRYYKLILSKYFGDILFKRIKKRSPKKMRNILQPDPSGTDGTAEWVDLCGLLCDRARVERLIQDVDSREIDSFDKLQSALMDIYNAYEVDEWNWFLAQYKILNGCNLASEEDEKLKNFIEDWKSASLKLVNMVLNDAEKEFDETARAGFGIDGARDLDFNAVRGTYEGNNFVKRLKQQTEE
ncbi:DUF4954 family protein, partial [Fibrobacterota bacterium]